MIKDNVYGLSHSKNIHVLLTKTITYRISQTIADSKKAKANKEIKDPKGRRGFFSGYFENP